MTTATEWLLDNPEDVEALSELLMGVEDLPIRLWTEIPKWMKQEIANQLKVTFEQPYWDDIAKTTLGDAERALEAGLQEGWSIRKIASQMRESLGGDRYAKVRALNIARTECLPADTVVNGANVESVYRRFYSGPFVKVITKAGREFSGTPNHPVLTTRGWVGLGDLKKSDNLVCYGFGVKKLGFSGRPDINHPPTTIGDIFDSLAAIGIGERRFGSNEDFHGDGMNGEIDVFASNGFLSYGNYSPIEQSRVDNVFTESDFRHTLLVAEGNLLSCGISESSGLGVVSQSHSRFYDDPLYACRIDTEGFCYRRAGFSIYIPRNNFGSTVCEVFGGGSVPSSEHQSTGFFSTPSLYSESLTNSEDGVFATSHDLANSNAAETGFVEIDQLQSIIRIESWSGHVFNLTTKDRFFSIADGVFTGNCGNALNGARKASINRLVEDVGDDVPMRSTWLSVLANTTRDTHANLDGTPCDKDGMWRLGGVKIPWPSHVSLPAKERCNCMCSLTIDFGMNESAAHEAIQEYYDRVDDYEAKSVKHLPGQHDQMSHAHGGSSVEQTLRSGKYESERINTETASGGFFKMTFEDGTIGVYKRGGDYEPNIRITVEAGTHYRREAAFYDVAKVVGNEDLVPETVVRRNDVTNIEGSVQKFVKDAQAIDNHILIDNWYGKSKKDIARAAAQDFVMGNTDRHQGNWVLSKGKIQLIDNGLSVPVRISSGNTQREELRRITDLGFVQQASANSMSLKSVRKQWEGKWEEIEKVMKSHEIDYGGIADAKKRYDMLMDPKYKDFYELTQAYRGSL